jgi:Na+/H+ antiporter NhaD/arsenite permease-like protein
MNMMFASLTDCISSFVPALPFVGLLLSIALLPLLFPALWHKIENFTLVFWASMGLAALISLFNIFQASHLVMETLWKDYVPFLVIIFALFKISGGIHVNFKGAGTPLNNAFIMTTAAFFSSFIGTTGASMLFIRPLLRLNKQRKQKVHLVIFFIVLVSNISGCLTPLGDPPLFLGYLEGVPFFWPLINLWAPFLFMLISLITLFLVIDFYFYKSENKKENQFVSKEHSYKEHSHGAFSIHGKRNIFILIAVVLTVILMQHMPEIEIGKILGVEILSNELFYLIFISGLGLVSHSITKPHSDHLNPIHLGPVFEVARVFLAIFITLIPVNHMLALGVKGPFAPLLTFLSQEQPPTKLYFWLTGLFSSFLDNAPTYLVFFELAGGSVNELITVKAPILKAISLGAVFMGALTYIGNAPNFMVLSIAREHSIKMPSFFHYLGIVSIFLFPLFLILSYICL